MADRFEDERGVIQDILAGPIDQVTQIFTRKGCVRGNHVHKETTQWTYIVSGIMWVAKDRGDGLIESHRAGAGELICEASGVPHAWRAVEDSLVLVFTRGPRSGENYEKDTIRLAEPILLPDTP
jgi:quercetin dioxygenase-like cupin family protein